MKKIALDLETVCNVSTCNGFNQYKLCRHALSPHHARITVIGAAWDGGQAVFRDLSDFKSWLKEDMYFLNHNFKFDWLMLAAAGIKLPLDKYIDDTHLMASVSTKKISEIWLSEFNRTKSSSTRHAGKHSLKSLAPYYLNVDPWEVEDKDDDEYVLKDCKYTIDLLPILKKQLEEIGGYKFYHDRLLNYTKMLMEAEARGLKLDWDKFFTLEKKLNEDITTFTNRLYMEWDSEIKQFNAALEKELYNKYNLMASKKGQYLETSTRYKKLYLTAVNKVKEFNLNSSSQLKVLLRDYIKADIKNFLGKESTDKAVLMKLTRDKVKGCDTLLKMRKFRDLLKFLTSYKELQIDGNIYPNFHPSQVDEAYQKGGTRTGRLSSSNPNLQQVNKTLRPIFKARPGYKLVGFDLGSIEAKLIALYTNDPLFYSITATDKSFHDVNTKNWFNLPEPLEEIKDKYPTHRQSVKRIGFSLCYGAGQNRIMRALTEDGFNFTEEECRVIHSRFKDQYKKVIAFHNSITKLFEQGETILNLLGRPIKIQNSQDAYMTGFNTLIQSSASDLCLEGAYRALTTMREKGIETYPVLFVHDFICFEVEEGRAHEAAEIIKHAMVNFDLKNDLGPIKLTVDGGIMTNWEIYEK